MKKKTNTTFFLGITGGIACGKSLVYKYFLDFGVKGISADNICRELMSPRGAAISEVKKHFGSGVISEDGTINRRRLGEIVFSDPGKLSILNGIMHPMVKDAITLWREGIKSLRPVEKLAVLEIPLLFETGDYFWLDAVVVVSSSRQKSIERMIKRDVLTEKQSNERYNAQLSLEWKKKKADFIIENNGDKEAAKRSAWEIFLSLTGGKKIDL